MCHLSSARLDSVQLSSAPSLLIDDLKTDRSVVIQLILRSLVLNGQIVDISWVLFQFGILPNAKVLMLLKFPEHQNYKKQPSITVGLRCGCKKKKCPYCFDSTKCYYVLKYYSPTVADRKTFVQVFCVL